MAMPGRKNIFYHLAFLALVMHIMVQITPLWMPKGEGLSIQICTTQGIQTITLDKNGNSAPAPTPSPKHDCPFCLAQTTSPLKAFETAPPPPVLIHARLKQGINQNPAFVPARQKAHQTRAPPATLS